MLYLDSRALLKRYVEEADSAACAEYLAADQDWLTARHTEVEVRRNLARLLEGRALELARASLRDDWQACSIVQLDDSVCAAAADIAEMTGARTLDALHLAAASRVGVGALTFLTFDIRQAQTARSLHLQVVGA